MGQRQQQQRRFLENLTKPMVCKITTTSSKLQLPFCTLKFKLLMAFASISARNCFWLFAHDTNQRRGMARATSSQIPFRQHERRREEGEKKFWVGVQDKLTELHPSQATVFGIVGSEASRGRDAVVEKEVHNCLGCFCFSSLLPPPSTHKRNGPPKKTKTKSWPPKVSILVLIFPFKSQGSRRSSERQESFRPKQLVPSLNLTRTPFERKGSCS